MLLEQNSVVPLGLCLSLGTARSAQTQDMTQFCTADEGLQLCHGYLGARKLDMYLEPRV